MNLKKLTPNLIVRNIEESLPFWVDRVGFEKTVEVPHEGRLGFVILKRGPIELMLQSQASLKADIAPLAEGTSFRGFVYLEVESLDPIRKALAGWPLVVPERTTFYGARELIVRDPDGHGVAFAAHGP